MENLTLSAKTDALERIFHEPNRLAILSTVCAEDKGLSFNELKERCGLTDGNLNRHLKVLQEGGVVRIEKKFLEAKPRTTVLMTRKGLAQFSEYLAALEAVLDRARQALPAEKRKFMSPSAQPAAVRI